jgi:hypothetical protein
MEGRNPHAVVHKREMKKKQRKAKRFQNEMMHIICPVSFNSQRKIPSGHEARLACCCKLTTDSFSHQWLTQNGYLLLKLKLHPFDLSAPVVD